MKECLQYESKYQWHRVLSEFAVYLSLCPYSRWLRQKRNLLRDSKKFREYLEDLRDKLRDDPARNQAQTTLHIPSAQPHGLCHRASLRLIKYTQWIPETPPFTLTPRLSPATLNKRNGFCKDWQSLGHMLEL